MEKPQWFEMAENDGPGRDIRATRKLPLLVLLSSLLVVGIGAVVAQGEESQPASASETVAVASAPAQSSPAAQGVETSNQSTSVTQTPSVTSVAPSATSVATSAPIAAPKIGQMPKGGGDDDDDRGGDHDDDRGHDSDYGDDD